MGQVLSAVRKQLPAIETRLTQLLSARDGMAQPSQEATQMDSDIRTLTELKAAVERGQGLAAASLWVRAVPIIRAETTGGEPK